MNTLMKTIEVTKNECRREKNSNFLQVGFNDTLKSL